MDASLPCKGAGSVRIVKRSVLLIGLQILGGMSAQSATYRALSFDALVAASEYIVYGKVVSSRPLWDPSTRAIWTETKVQVLDAEKGQPGAAVLITEPGGVLNGRGELYPGTPQLRPDAEMVLFVYRAPGNRLRVLGAVQGMFAVFRDPGTGQRVVAATADQTQDRVLVDAGIQKRSRTPVALPAFLQAIRQKAVAR